VRGSDDGIAVLRGSFLLLAPESMRDLSGCDLLDRQLQPRLRAMPDQPNTDVLSRLVRPLFHDVRHRADASLPNRVHPEHKPPSRGVPKASG
jgi:hypothetical protein